MKKEFMSDTVILILLKSRFVTALVMAFPILIFRGR